MSEGWAKPSSPCRNSLRLGKGRLLMGRSSAVAIATCAEVAGVERDDLKVIETLRKRGVGAVHAAWDDPSVVFAAPHFFHAG